MKLKYGIKEDRFVENNPRLWSKWEKWLILQQSNWRWEMKRMIYRKKEGWETESFGFGFLDIFIQIHCTGIEEINDLYIFIQIHCTNIWKLGFFRFMIIK